MDKFFCYCPDAGFDTFETEKEAKESAETSIDWYRDNAEEGWNEEVNQVCWGEIKQQASICNEMPASKDNRYCETTCDYQLKP